MSEPGSDICDGGMDSRAGAHADGRSRVRDRGRFAEVPNEGGAGTALWSTSCAFTDVDRDGFLDLFVTNYVKAERTNNKFCGKRSPVMLRGYCHPRAYDPSPNVLYRNTGKGLFHESA